MKALFPFELTEKIMEYVARTKHFVNISSANQNYCRDNFTCYGDNCGNNSYCYCNKWNCHHSNVGLMGLPNLLLRQQSHFLRVVSRCVWNQNRLSEHVLLCVESVKRTRYGAWERERKPRAALNGRVDAFSYFIGRSAQRRAGKAPLY